MVTHRFAQQLVAAKVQYIDAGLFGFGGRKGIGTTCNSLVAGLLLLDTRFSHRCRFPSSSM